MNIGIVCYPTYGGSGVVATELGKALALRGHKVHFITYKQLYSCSKWPLLANHLSCSKLCLFILLLLAPPAAAINSNTLAAKDVFCNKVPEVTIGGITEELSFTTGDGVDGKGMLDELPSAKNFASISCLKLS